MILATIGILVALLLPSLHRAKQHVGPMTDLDNFRQIMVALHLYTANNNDVLPPPNWDNGGFLGAQGLKTGWLYKPNLMATGTNAFNVTTGLFWDTLHDPKLYFCPMDKPESSPFGSRPQQSSSYGMNGAVIGFGAMIYPPVKLASLRATDCLFWETDETRPENFNDGANYPGQGVSGRHPEGGIQATLDASVSYVALNVWQADMVDTNRNRLWCYPNSPDGGDPQHGHNP